MASRSAIRAASPVDSSSSWPSPGSSRCGPQHLVLDEPTAQLDPAGTRLVAEAISRLAADGGSILVTEQKTDLLAATCTRVAVLDGGRVAIVGPAESVLADERLPSLGVTEPSSVRLRRAIAAAGLDEPRIAAALADA